MIRTAVGTETPGGSVIINHKRAARGAWVARRGRLCGPAEEGNRIWWGVIGTSGTINWIRGSVNMVRLMSGGV